MQWSQKCKNESACYLWRTHELLDSQVMIESKKHNREVQIQINHWHHPLLRACSVPIVRVVDSVVVVSARQQLSKLQSPWIYRFLFEHGGFVLNMHAAMSFYPFHCCNLVVLQSMLTLLNKYEATKQPSKQSKASFWGTPMSLKTPSKAWKNQEAKSCLHPIITKTCVLLLACQPVNGWERCHSELILWPYL